MVVHLRSARRTSKTPLSISFNIQTHVPRSRSLKTRPRHIFLPTSLCLDIGWNHACCFWYISFKLINYSWSCSQKPINDNHLGQVDESWYHHVFIWSESCFSSQIKHLHFNGYVFYWLTQLMETMKIPVKTFHCI